MHRVERVVDVEDDRGWCPLPAGTEQVHHCAHHPRNLGPARGVLQPRHRWLRTQRLPPPPPPAPSLPALAAGLRGPPPPHVVAPNKTGPPSPGARPGPF